MIGTRSLVISLAWAMLSAMPLTCAQGMKTPKTRVGLQHPVAIQELELQSQHFLGSPLEADSSVPGIYAQDLSTYRGFQLGMNLLTVAKQADPALFEARTIHQRPAVIQELEWRPQLSLASPADAVLEVLLSFYNGELFRMVVNYDPHRTAGLTDEDMIEGISAKYGSATRPEGKIILFSSFHVYNDSERVIARWEDRQSSFNLFRSSYQPTFGMLVFSKQLDALAQAAIVEAIRLDEQEAPQRELERQRKEDGDNRAEQDKVRLVNKTAFRP
jgi:hypothetical protein